MKPSSSHDEVVGAAYAAADGNIDADGCAQSQTRDAASPDAPLRLHRDIAGEVVA